MRAGGERKDAREWKEELDGEGNKAEEINRKSARRGWREKDPISECGEGRGRTGTWLGGRSK